MRTLLTVLFLIAWAGPVFGQAPPPPPGVVTPQSTNPATNPFFPVQPFPGQTNPATGLAIPPSVPGQIDPSTGNLLPGSPVSPTQPWMGINSPQPMIGQVIRQVWVEPQIVPIQVYVLQPEGIPEVWQTQLVQIPGYWTTETTQGTIYAPRWTLENPGYGVYQWRQLPGYFQPRR